MADLQQQDFTGLFLPGQPAYRLLERLKDLQLQFDPKGVLAFDPTANTTDISMAMTLRDATMFVKLTPSGANVRLGDLDPKSGDSARKVEHWRGTEESLIKEGWYEGTESESLKKGWGTHTSCSLWRS
jgi:inositol-pentakisphosphate 2-kinase